MWVQIRKYLIGASVAFVVWSFTTWAGLGTRVTVIESYIATSIATKADLVPIITDVAVIKESLKRIEEKLK